MWGLCFWIQVCECVWGGGVGFKCVEGVEGMVCGYVDMGLLSVILYHTACIMHTFPYVFTLPTATSILSYTHHQHHHHPPTQTPQTTNRVFPADLLARHVPVVCRQHVHPHPLSHAASGSTIRTC